MPFPPAFRVKRPQGCSGILRWPPRCHRVLRETRSSRWSLPVCRSSVPKAWSWRSCHSSDSRDCWERWTPNHGGTSRPRSKRCSRPWRATSRSSCCQATCTSDGVPCSTTGVHLMASLSVQLASCNWSRVGSPRIGAISHRRSADTHCHSTCSSLRPTRSCSIPSVSAGVLRSEHR